MLVSGLKFILQFNKINTLPKFSLNKDVFVHVILLQVGTLSNTMPITNLHETSEKATALLKEAIRYERQRSWLKVSFE